MLRDAGTEGEIAGEQTHQERANNVHDERSEREFVAQKARCADVHSVAERATKTGSDEDNEVEHKPPTAARLR